MNFETKKAHAVICARWRYALIFSVKIMIGVDQEVDRVVRVSVARLVRVMSYQAKVRGYDPAFQIQGAHDGSASAYRSFD